ncbi:unannotated protein [freshwater metagenome]|uniref:Unannotated protein n=1 Tax=freshwater metagenome TaxID=449393 RepID=A0A6J7NUY4_9ZZZZ
MASYFWRMAELIASFAFCGSAATSVVVTSQPTASAAATNEALIRASMGAWRKISTYAIFLVGIAGSAAADDSAAEADALVGVIAAELLAAPPPDEPQAARAIAVAPTPISSAERRSADAPGRCLVIGTPLTGWNYGGSTGGHDI